MPRRPPVYAADSLLYSSPPRYRLALVREPEPTKYAEPPAMNDPRTVSEYLNRSVADEPAELMGALYVDTRHRLIAHSVLYRGSLNRAAVEPRGVLQAGLLCGAAGMILYHNHPSGDPSPSAEDMAFTRRLSEAGELVGIRLLDHIILTGSLRYHSLRERGAF